MGQPVPTALQLYGRRASRAAWLRAVTAGASVLVGILLMSGAVAQERPRLFDPDDGAFDLSEYLAHPRAFLPVPIVVTEPAVGYGGGLAALFLRPRRDAGDEGWARPDLAAFGAMATENGTRAGFAGDARHWADGRLRSLVGIGTGRANLDFYGPQVGAPAPDQSRRVQLLFTGAVAQLNWQLAPRSPWAVGLRYVYADVDPELRDAGASAAPSVEYTVRVSGPTAILEYDSRDNLFTPTRGIYAEASYLASIRGLGATTDWERFHQVAMAWASPTPGLVLGGRADFAAASSGTPFFLRPYITLRGVPAVRYQGDRSASVELEGRWQFHGRWSAVAFGGAGRTENRHGPFDGHQQVGAGGVGLRYELARRFGMHAGIDLARSADTTAVYLVVGNAWFRP